jgi:hypothetical protein
MSKNLVIAVILAIALGVTGFVVFSTLRRSSPATSTTLQNVTPTEEDIQKNTSVTVEVTESSAKDNTIVLSLGDLKSAYAGLTYEITYESNGILKGVNSGSKPLDITNQESWDRDVYLGTCSKNVCKPDVGVTTVSVSLEFTDIDGMKTQFSQDYPL